jgi:hypothetical protein
VLLQHKQEKHDLARKKRELFFARNWGLQGFLQIRFVFGFLCKHSKIKIKFTKIKRVHISTEQSKQNCVLETSQQSTRSSSTVQACLLRYHSMLVAQRIAGSTSNATRSLSEEFK